MRFADRDIGRGVQPFAQFTQLLHKTILIGQQLFPPHTRLGVAHRQLAEQLAVEPVGKAFAYLGRPVHPKPFAGEICFIAQFGPQWVQPQLLFTHQLAEAF